MGETWLTSDLHLGHEFVAGTRGFASSAEHDAALAAVWDRRIAPSDEVWVLGDVALGGWRDRLAWVGERPGTKHLVLGNHDRAHPMHRRAHTYVPAFAEVFDSVQSAATLRHGGETLLLSHFPYDGEGADRDADDDRCSQWRLRDEGKTLLHGHVHDRVRARRSAAGSLMLHVGLDAWGAPVTLTDALAAQTDPDSAQRPQQLRSDSGALPVKNSVSTASSTHELERP